MLKDDYLRILNERKGSSANVVAYTPSPQAGQPLPSTVRLEGEAGVSFGRKPLTMADLNQPLKLSASEQSVREMRNPPASYVQAEATRDESQKPTFFYGLYDTVAGLAKEQARKAYDQYLRPLASYAYRQGTYGLAGDMLAEANRNVQDDRIIREMPEILAGTAKGLASGITLGLADSIPQPYAPIGISGITPSVDLNAFEPSTEGGRAAEKTADFLSYMLPYEGAEKLLLSGATKMIPEFVVKHPRLVRRLADLVSFTGTTQLSADAFTLTPEEKEAGITHLQKRAQIAGMDALGFSVFKLGGAIFNALKGQGLTGMASDIEAQLKDAALRELKVRSRRIENAATSQEAASVAARTETMLEEYAGTGAGMDAASQKEVDRMAEKISELKEEHPAEFVKEKYKNRKAKNIDGIGKESVQAQISEPVDIAEPAPFVPRKPENVQLSKTLDFEQMVHDAGYKSVGDLELQSASHANQLMIGGDELAEGFDLPGGFDATDGFSIMASDSSPESAMQDSIRSILYDNLVSKHGITGIAATKKPTIEKKALLKRLLSYSDAPAESRAAAFKSIDAITESSSVDRLIGSTLDILADDIYRKVQNGEKAVLTRTVDPERVQRIVDLFFEKKNFTTSGLADAVIGAYGKKKAGSNSFNTAKKLLQELGYENVTDFAKDIDAAAGTQLVRNGRLTMGAGEAIREADRLAQQAGKKDAAELATSWEEEALAEARSNPLVGERNVGDMLGGSFENLRLADYANAIESSQNIRKDMEGGFIALGLEKQPLEQANGKVEELFKQRTSFIDKLTEGVRDTKDNVIGAMRTLSAEPEKDPRISRNYPRFVIQKYDIYNTPKVLSEVGKRTAINIVKDLSREEYEVFNRLVVSADLLVTNGKGLKLPREISRDEVLSFMQSLKAQYEKYPRVREALVRHFKIMKAMREGIDQSMKGKGYSEMNWGANFPESERSQLTQYMRDFFGIANIDAGDIYFPHVVTKYIDESYLGHAFTPLKVRRPMNGFLKKREGSVADIYTDYVPVVSHYVASNLSSVALDKKFVDILADYDALRLFTKEERKAFKGVVSRNGQVFTREQMPESIAARFPSEKFVAYQYEPGNFLYPAETFDQKALQEMVDAGLDVGEMLMADGDAYTKTILAVGQKKPFVLLPEEIYRQVSKLREPQSQEVSSVLRLLQPYTMTWKAVATKYFGGPKWRLFNSFQDYLTLLTKQPTALNDIPASLKASYYMTWGRDRVPAEYKDLLKFLEDNQVGIAGFLHGDEVLSGQMSMSAFLKRASDGWDNISSFLELSPHIASIVDNLKRVEAGKAPVVKGSSPYIKSLVEQGNFVDAVAEYGKDVTVDYSKIPPEFRKYASSSLAPFSFWFVRNGAAMQRLARDSKKTVLGYSMFVAATTVWNNSGENRTYEQALPEYRRYTPHIFLGVDEKGKAHWLYLENPINSALAMFGLNALPSIVADVAAGSITPQQGAAKLLTTIPKQTARFAVNLLNPAVRVMSAVATNRDSFSNQEIIPKEYQTDAGAGQRMKMYLEYAVANLFTPFNQASILSSQIDVKANPEGFLAGMLAKPFDVAGSFHYSMPQQQALYNAERSKASDLLNERDIRNQEIFQLIADGDTQRLGNILEDMQQQPDGQYQMQSLISYMGSESTQRRFFGEMLTKIEDPEKREQMKNMYYMLMRLGNIQSVPDALKGRVIGQ